MATYASPTEWYVVGLNYMINRDWGIGVRIPSANRSFTSDANPGGTPAIDRHL